MCRVLYLGMNVARDLLWHLVWMCVCVSEKCLSACVLVLCVSMCYVSEQASKQASSGQHSSSTCVHTRKQDLETLQSNAVNCSVRLTGINRTVSLLQIHSCVFCTNYLLYRQSTGQFMHFEKICVSLLYTRHLISVLIELFNAQLKTLYYK